ncbi:PPA1309 family protein [Nakamurella leprariae]|uniref:PPA1309 family protein n=1 Tax=Nakamurella leprariae TaxID=2803911 RepID=UPI0038B41575
MEDGAQTPQDDPARWLEDPDLAVAVAEVDEFVGAAGWDQAPQLFALVRTEELLRAQPSLADQLAGAATYTPIAQEALPGGAEAGGATTDLEAALAAVSWPQEVAGCVVVQEIVVLPPSAAASLPAEPDRATAEAADHPDRTEARLTAGVLRGRPGGACLLRVRPAPAAGPVGPIEPEPGPEPLRGGDLAPNLVAALHATFED